MAAEIDHVVVLMLENRSFDQLLGFHPSSNPDFDGLLRGGPYTNPGYQGSPPVAAEPTGKHVLPVDPDHAHDAVMLQLGLRPGASAADLRRALEGKELASGTLVGTYQR